MSRRGKSNEHYWNTDRKGHATAIYEAAAHPFSAFALGLAY